ncbi:MAG: hypothetical protein WBM86_12480 [Waterburya sp.]
MKIRVDEKDPIAYLYKDVIDSGEKVEAEVVSDEAEGPADNKIVVKEDPLTKLKNQIEKQARKLKEDSKISKVVSDKNKLEESVKEITASFETQIKAFQDLMTPEFLEKQELLKDLGKDLPVEDIDKIYFVHGAGNLDETIPLFLTKSAIALCQKFYCINV